MAAAHSRFGGCFGRLGDRLRHASRYGVDSGRRERSGARSPGVFSTARQERLLPALRPCAQDRRTPLRWRPELVRRYEMGLRPGPFRDRPAGRGDRNRGGPRFRVRRVPRPFRSFPTRRRALDDSAETLDRYGSPWLASRRHPPPFSGARRHHARNEGRGAQRRQLTGAQERRRSRRAARRGRILEHRAFRGPAEPPIRPAALAVRQRGIQESFSGAFDFSQFAKACCADQHRRVAGKRLGRLRFADPRRRR